MVVTALREAIDASFPAVSILVVFAPCLQHESMFINRVLATPGGAARHSAFAPSTRAQKYCPARH